MQFSRKPRIAKNNQQYFFSNHQEKLLFRQKTLTEKNPSLRHKKLNKTHFGKSGFG